MANENTSQASAATPAGNEGSAPHAPLESQIDTEAPESVETQLDGMSFEDMERVLSAPPAKKPTQASPKDEDDEEEGDEEGDEPTETEGASSPRPGEVPSKPLPKNFRFHTDDKQRANFLSLLKKHPEKSPLEIARFVGYDDGQQSQQTPPAEVPPAAQQPDPLQGIRDELAALEKQQEDLLEAYEYGEAIKVGKLITAKTLELERGANKVAEHTSYQAEFQSAYQSARADALALFPETGTAGTPQHRLVAMLVAQKEKSDPDFFQDPAYPVRILDELQRDFPNIFVKGATQQPGTRPRVAARASSRPVGEVVSGNAGGAQTPSKEEAADAIEHMSFDELARVANDPRVGTQSGRKRTR